MKKILVLVLFFASYFSGHACCLSLTKSNAPSWLRRRTLRKFVFSLDPATAVTHVRTSTEDYGNYKMSTIEGAYIHTLIAERRECDKQWAEKFIEIFESGNEKRRLSLVMTAKRVHNDRKERKSLNKDRLPSAIAANGLPLSPTNIPRETIHNSTITPHILVTRESDSSDSQQ